jgi:hypothetical protein
MPILEQIDDDNDSISSADEALFEMLGFTNGKRKNHDILFSILQESKERESDTKINDHDSSLSSMSNDPCFPSIPQNYLEDIINQFELDVTYRKESVCLFPQALSISPKLMRKLTDELLYGTTKYPSDRSYENIKILTSDGENRIEKRREITRFENFVNGHKKWYDLCHGYLAKLISTICGQEMVLFKEKLNLKPPGGTGFAPHLDSPSLQIALGDEGPSTFVTVMVAIDDMTEKNGCLKVWKGPWNESNHLPLIEPEVGGDPDAGGRAGAIHPNHVEDEKFESVVCKGGDILAFNGWVPHRSSANASFFSRRAVFLTYNPASEGDFHDAYYCKMTEKRNKFRDKAKALNNADLECEMEALSSIPGI